MPYQFVEFPKWLHAEGRKSVVVEDAEEEAARLAEWAALDAPRNPLLGSANVVMMPKKGGWPKGKPRPKKVSA